MKVYDLDGMGNRIKELRKGKKMTQKYVAEHLNVTRSCIANWETGKREIDVALWREISMLFDVSIEYLCGEKEFVGCDKKCIDFTKLNDSELEKMIEYYEFLLKNKQIPQDA